MKKNKTVAYMLAATLLVGGTFLGTKALFTDKIETAGTLQISTGDVDIEVTDKVDSKWELTRNGSPEALGELDKDEDDQTFDNLKFGDKLTKEVNFENKGTLKAMVSLDKSSTGDINNLPEGIAFTPEFIHIDAETNKETILEMNQEALFEPGDKGKVKFKIQVTQGGEHSKTSKTINSDAQEVDIMNLTNAYTLNANQIGASELPQ